MAKATLHFQSENHDLEKLRGVAASGPRIEVKAEDIVPIGTIAISIRNDARNSDDDKVVFVKHENKFIVLLGKKKALAALAANEPVAGFLVSKPALKKCRIVFIPEHERAINSARRTYPRSY